MRSRAAPLRGALAVTALCATVAGLRQAGGQLGSPPLHSWAEASEWYERLGPVTATFAAVRLMALVIAGWLLAAAAAELLATASPRSLARPLADLIAPRSLQRIVHGLAGLSLTAGLTATAPSAGTTGEPDDGVAVLRLLDDEGDPGTATLRLAEEPPAAVPVAQAVQRDEVIVEPGDSLWSIAEEALADARGAHAAPANDAAVATYWRRVIEANRSALVDPTNPDLIYPGQVMALPAP